jgi:hypothetical protein
MRLSTVWKAFVAMAGCATAALCLSAQTPTAGTPAPVKAEGVPPRAAPTDYQAHGEAGPVTVGAEFTGHSVATPESTLTTEDFVVIETGVYGAPGTPIKLSREDFQLRINGKKVLLPSQPFGLVVKTLKDPELEPTASETKSKTSIGTGGQGGASDPPPPYRVPDDLRHAWGQRLQKISLPEGNRTLPQAGLIYFIYRGKTEKLQSVELIYTGPTGTATLALQP